MSILSYLSVSSRPQKDFDFSKMRPYSGRDEAATASVRRAFMEYTTTGQEVTEMNVASLANEDLARDPALAEQADLINRDPFMRYAGAAPERRLMRENLLPKYTDRDELRSILAEQGVTFSDKIPMPPEGLTLARARIYQQNLEAKEADELIMANARPGLATYAAEFAGGLVGSLADPVNFIPFAGGLNRARQLAEGTKILSRAGLKVLGRSALIGAGENVAAVGLSNAVAFPMANRWGADLGWEDAAASLAFAGVLGSAFSTLGTFIGKRAAAELNLDALVKAVADAEAGRPLDVAPILESTVRAAEGTGVQVRPVAEVLARHQDGPAPILGESIKELEGQGSQFELVNLNSVSADFDAARFGDLRIHSINQRTLEAAWDSVVNLLTHGPDPNHVYKGREHTRGKLYTGKLSDGLNRMGSGYFKLIFEPGESFAKSRSEIRGVIVNDGLIQASPQIINELRAQFPDIEIGAFSELNSVASRIATSTTSAHAPGRPGPAPKGAGKASLAHEGVTSLDELYKRAAELKDGFQGEIRALAEATGGEAYFRPGDGLKTRARAEEKISRDYGGDAGRVVDALGGTILYDSKADIQAALPEIERRVVEAGGQLFKKDRFEKPSSGYKDIKLNIQRPDGFVTELLLTTKAMHKAKMGAEHDLYEAKQLVDKFIDFGEGTPEQIAGAEELSEILKDAGKALYDSTGDQSNATASFSVIVEPLDKISALRPEAFFKGSSVYPKLDSLLGNIRKSLPPVANTYGTSSYSRNSLTNMGSLGVPDSHGTPIGDLPSASRALATSGTETPPIVTDGLNITLPAEKSKSGAVVPGREGKIIIEGQPDETVRYEVREAADLIPSHKPGPNFVKREDYPANVQERPYHSDQGEQDKVHRHAMDLKPERLINNNPDLVNGPPVITEDGVVLGGNSRAMTLELAYGNNKAGAYREILLRDAAFYGLDPAAVAGMENPVLVRVVSGEMTPAEMAVKSRLYNQTPTQALQAKAQGVSQARLFTPETLDGLAESLAEFDSLREFLASGKSRLFIEALKRDGVLELTQLSRLTDAKTKLLNDEGKTLVENTLRGLVIPDYDVLGSAPASALNKLDRAVPALAKLKARGEGWDISGEVTAALRQLVKAQDAEMTVPAFLLQREMFGTNLEKERPAVQILALTFDKANQKEIQARFEFLAREAEAQPKGQMALPGLEGISPDDAFRAAFLEPMAVAGQAKTYEAHPARFLDQTEGRLLPEAPEPQPVSFERAGPDGVELDARAMEAEAGQIRERAAQEPDVEAAALEAEMSYLAAQVEELHRNGVLPAEEAALVDEAVRAVSQAERERTALETAAECVIENLKDFV